MHNSQCHKRPENEEIPPIEIVEDFKKIKVVRQKTVQSWEGGEEER